MLRLIATKAILHSTGIPAPYFLQPTVTVLMASLLLSLCDLGSLLPPEQLLSQQYID